MKTVTEGGTVENEYDYDIFGNPTLTIENYANSIRYAGEFYDTETGLYYLRARYYDPYQGRFISQDTFTGDSSNPLSLNLYTYCHNDPIQYTDPSGHWALADEEITDDEARVKLSQLTDLWYAAADDDKITISKYVQRIRDNAPRQKGHTSPLGKKFRDKLGTKPYLSYDEWVSISPTYDPHLIQNLALPDGEITEDEIRNLLGKYAYDKKEEKKKEDTGTSTGTTSGNTVSNQVKDLIDKSNDGYYYNLYLESIEKTRGRIGLKAEIFGVDPWQLFMYCVNAGLVNPNEEDAFEKFVNLMGPTWETAYTNRSWENDVRDACIAILTPLIIFGGLMAIEATLTWLVQGSVYGDKIANRVFWSGKDVARGAAENYAIKNGGTTLEMTEKGIELANRTKDMPWKEAKPLWEAASREFARGASGEVVVFQRADIGVTLESVWAQTEYGILLNNPNVTKIIYKVIMPNGSIETFGQSIK